MIAPGLIRQALQSGTKAALQNATIAGMASSGVGLLEDQVKQYERDVVNPGIRMLPWENTSEYPIFQLGTEIIGEQVGLLKYLQDKTIQPWIDLAKRGYGELRERNESGRSGDTKNTRPSTRGAGPRVSEKNKGASPFVQNRLIRPIPVPARVPRYRSK